MKFRRINVAMIEHLFYDGESDNENLTVEGDSGVSDDDGPTQIRFRKGSSPVDSRRQRRQASIRDARRAMIRAVLIAGVLFYAAYRGLQWVEDRAKEFEEI